MRFAILFPLISLGLCLVIRNNGGWTWILAWPAFSCLLVAVAYAIHSPKIFGKRPDGTMAWWSVTLLLPYLLFSWLLWHAVRLAHRLHSNESHASQISPTLWLSRRLLPHEIPQDVTCIIDMTCEFPAPAPPHANHPPLPLPSHSRLRHPHPKRPRSPLQEAPRAERPGHPHTLRPGARSLRLPGRRVSRRQWPIGNVRRRHPAFESQTPQRSPQPAPESDHPIPSSPVWLIWG